MTSFVFCFFFTSSHWYCLFFCSLSIGSMGVWGQRPANCISFSLCHHLLYFLFPLLPVSPSHIVYLYFIPPPVSPSVPIFLSLPFSLHFYFYLGLFISWHIPTIIFLFFYLPSSSLGNFCSLHLYNPIQSCSVVCFVSPFPPPRWAGWPSIGFFF